MDLRGLAHLVADVCRWENCLQQEIVPISGFESPTSSREFHAKSCMLLTPRSSKDPNV